MHTFQAISARALRERAARHCESSLTALEPRARLVHRELAQRYTLQALATIIGPCGARSQRPTPTPQSAHGERVTVLP